MDFFQFLLFLCFIFSFIIIFAGYLSRPDVVFLILIREILVQEIEDSNAL